jgi:hypothetical protein
VFLRTAGVEQSRKIKEPLCDRIHRERQFELVFTGTPEVGLTPSRERLPALVINFFFTQSGPSKGRFWACFGSCC